MRRKGGAESWIVESIIGLVTTLTAIGIALAFSGIVGTAGGEQSDRDQINSLAENINNKCVDSRTADPADGSTSVMVELNSYERIFYDPEDNKLMAEKSDSSIEYNLDNCDYQFEGFPVEREDGTAWNFDISIASTNPSVIEVSTGQ